MKEGFTKTKDVFESDVNKSENVLDFRSAKNYWNPTTFRFVFELLHVLMPNF